jgi:phospholipid-translocating ATPase
MVIDGQSLAEALNDHRSLLSEVAENCEAVVCCRMSPLQKAEVLFIFNKTEKHVVCINLII